MSNDQTDVHPAADSPPLDVQIVADPHGGWHVDALCDGHVVATRHSDDWHRVERLRERLSAELRQLTPAASLPRRG